MLKEKLQDVVILLASAEDGKASLVAGVKGTPLGQVKAGELLAHVAAQIGGKGGGRPDMAQGGGQDGPALIAALDGVAQLGRSNAWYECTGGLCASVASLRSGPGPLYHRESCVKQQLGAEDRHDLGPVHGRIGRKSYADSDATRR